jgi:hypothetical protein
VRRGSFAAACELGIEGIAKRLTAPYKSGPCKAWIKVRNPKSPAYLRIVDGRCRAASGGSGRNVVQRLTFRMQRNPKMEVPMRKLTVGLLAAAAIAFAVPAHAQGFWFDPGPFGVGFGSAPYAYGYGSSWGGPYGYAPGYAYGYAPGYAYGYAPGYTYAPGYDVSVGYGPAYDYSYAPDYGYTTSYEAPSYIASTPYAYEPEYRYGRSVVRVRTSHPIARRHVEYRTAHISGEAYRAQASAPVRHVVRHSRSVTMGR